MVSSVAIGHDVDVDIAGQAQQVLDDRPTQHLVQHAVARVTDDDAAHILSWRDLHQGPGHVSGLDADRLRTQVLREAQVLLQRALVLGSRRGPAAVSR